MDEDDCVYASILARVGRPELDKPLHNVLRRGYRSIGRQVDRASSSLAAARQLQAAAEFLRPSGDWQPKTLRTQLKSIEQLQGRLKTDLDELGRKTRQKKRKRKRPAERAEDEERKTKAKEKPLDRDVIVLDGDEDDDEEEESDPVVVEKNSSANAHAVVEVLEEEEQEGAEEESGVEFLQVMTPADVGVDGRTGDEEDERAVTVEQCSRPVDVVEDEEEHCDVEIVDVESDSEKIEEGGGVECVEYDGAVLECCPEDSDGGAGTNEEGDAVPSGLVRRTRDEAVRVKEEEAVTLTFKQAVLEVDQEEACEAAPVDGSVEESPMELDVPESSEESAVELEMSDSEQVAIKLEVFDSDDDDDFSPCRELVDKLQNEGDAAHQLAVFPQTVTQLRSYLIDCKHFEEDEYLYAHKSFSDGELKELGCAIETIASVGINLPRRPRVKMALNDLLTLVEQLEHTLGELPTFLDPVVEQLSSYFSLTVKKKAPEAAR